MEEEGPILHARIAGVRVVAMVDEDPDLSYLEQTYNENSGTEADRQHWREQDAERLAAYNRGDWHCVGIRAVADIEFVRPEGTKVGGQVIESDGLWGIESDSEPSYFEEIGREQLSELLPSLEALGFTSEAIEKAYGEIDYSGAL